MMNYAQSAEGRDVLGFSRALGTTATAIGILDMVGIPAQGVVAKEE